MSKMFKVRPLTEKSAEACVRLGTNPLLLSHTRQRGSGNASGESCMVCSLEGVRFTRSLNRRNEFDSLWLGTELSSCCWSSSASRHLDLGVCLLFVDKNKAEWELELGHTPPPSWESL